MSIDVVLRNGTSVVKTLESGGGPQLMEWLSEWQKEVLKQIASGKDPIELYRAQGRLEVLNRISGLKQEIRNYQDGVRNGTLKKI